MLTSEGYILTLMSNSYCYLGIWTGILAALLHSILDGNLSVVPANALHFYVLLGILITSIYIEPKPGTNKITK